MEKNFENITEEEKNILNNFERQLQTIFWHERYIYRLGVSLKRLYVKIRSSEEYTDDIKKMFDVVKGRVAVLEKEVLEKFKILQEDTSQEDEIYAYERKKRERIIETGRFLQNIYNSLSKEEKALEGISKRAIRKIKRAMRRIKEGVDEKNEEFKANEAVLMLLEDMKTFKKSINETLAVENKILLNILEMDLEECFKDTEKKRRTLENFEEYEKVLKSEIGIIKKKLRTFKYKVYRPLMHYLGIEVGGEKLVEKFRGVDKIDIDDIKADIYTMTDSIEIKNYISALKQYRQLILPKAMEHLENYEDMAEQLIATQRGATITDDLTKLFNKKLMLVELNNLVQHYIPGKGNSFSFILMDIDNFKSVNDTLGHLAGDWVLSEIGKIIISTIRGSDVGCRYGGEELAVILPRLELKQAIAIAERIRKLIEKHRFNLADKRTITVSMGVAEFGEQKFEENDDMSEEELKAAKSQNSYFRTVEGIIKLTDHRLYVAKATGKNKVVSEGFP